MKRIAYCGLLAGMAILLSYIESLFPIPIPVPGVKLGLSNTAVLIAIYHLSIRDAFCVMSSKVFIVSLLFSGPSGFLYGISGGILSFFFMVAAKRANIFSAVGIGMCGGVSHNIGQLITAAIIILNCNLFFYTPVLILSGVATGILTGLTAHFVLLRISPTYLRSSKV